MPHFDKLTKRYTGQVMFQGRKLRQRGFETKDLAKEWEVETKKRLKYPHLYPTEPEAKPPEPGVSFRSLATSHLDDCKVRMQRNTVRAKDAYYSQFLTFLGEVDYEAASVSKSQIRAYLAGVQAQSGAKTANRHLRDLKALFQWAVSQESIVKNPALGIPPYPEEPFVKYVPPAKDIDAVIMAAGPQEGDLLLVLYHLGARIGEIIRLTWDDVNFEHRWVRLWTRKRKRGQLEGDLLPMSDKLGSVLKSLWRGRDTSSPYVFNVGGRQLTRDSDFIRHLMERLCKRAGVKRFTFHAIRHHVASVLQDSGKATMKELQLFLRHKRQTTTEHYLHSIDPRLQRIVQVLDGESGECKNECKNFDTTGK